MAINILPDEPDSGENFARAFGSTFVPGLSQALDSRTLRDALSSNPNATLEEKMNLVQGLNISPEAKSQLSKSFSALAKLRQQQQQQMEKQQREQVESQILSKYQMGQQLTPEETSQLSPTSLRSMIGQQKEMFEPTEQRLEAERVSQLATDIENDYKNYQAEETRLNRMEKLSESGELSTPLMIKTLQNFNLPIGVLQNPNTEEYSKLEADFLRDVRQVFPGGRITNYEIQAYLKTIPSLMNSKEGRAAIVRNKKLQNEAKKIRYDAYRDILKENKGTKPRNLGLQIDDRTSKRIGEIENQFRDGVQSQIEKTQQPIMMKAPNGKIIDVPPNLVEQALKDGLKF